MVIWFLQSALLQLVYRMKIFCNKEHEKPMRLYKVLLMEEISITAKNAACFTKKKLVWLYALSNCRVALHSSFISCKQKWLPVPAEVLVGANSSLTQHWGVNVKVLLVTEEFAVDLSRCSGWGKVTVSCLWIVTDVFYVKIHLAEVQPWFVHPK